MLGTTAEELTTLADGKITRFCLDFVHLYCAANYRKIPYPQALKPFQALTIRHFHLSNSTDGSIGDRHLPLDHPDGGLPFPKVMRCIRARPGVPVNLEYRRPAGFYEAQIAVFDAVYLCGVEGAEREGSLRKGGGESGAPSSLSRRTANLNVGGGQHDSIVCCGGISTGCIRPRIRRP